MKSYYFTFGQDHYTIRGIAMRNYYVEVVAPSFEKARDMFRKTFATPVMGNADKWAFQYEEVPSGNVELFTIIVDSQSPNI
jgi:hypothetical protein